MEKDDPIDVKDIIQEIDTGKLFRVINVGPNAVIFTNNTEIISIWTDEKITPKRIWHLYKNISKINQKKIDSWKNFKQE